MYPSLGGCDRRLSCYCLFLVPLQILPQIDHLLADTYIGFGPGISISLYLASITVPVALFPFLNIKQALSLSKSLYLLYDLRF